MSKTRRFFVALVIAGPLLPAGYLTVRTGRRFARAYARNTECCSLPVLRNSWLSLQQSLGVTLYYGQFGQDMWVVETALPGVSAGFFLDVGSADGIDGSNTKALEDRGWTGICVDPFPTHMAGRTCRMFKDVVGAQSGIRVKFKEAGFLGGIVGKLNTWKDNSQVVQSREVEFTTVSLADILARARAPVHIDYMSLDIEGAELDALRGFPFDRYSVGAMTVEHNGEEPKRSDIRRFLAARGYERVHSSGADDFYVQARR